MSSDERSNEGLRDMNSKKIHEKFTMLSLTLTEIESTVLGTPINTIDYPTDTIGRLDLLLRRLTSLENLEHEGSV